MNQAGPGEVDQKQGLDLGTQSHGDLGENQLPSLR